MNKSTGQMDLFQSQPLNPVYEIKRAIRISLSNTSLSRDQVVDAMNRISMREGMRKSISKAALDNWCKDSDPDRLPSLPWLTIFCRVVDNPAPIAAMLSPLGYGIIGKRQKQILLWADAELSRRKAVKRAKHALSGIEDI